MSQVPVSWNSPPLLHYALPSHYGDFSPNPLSITIILSTRWQWQPPPSPHHQHTQCKITSIPIPYCTTHTESSYKLLLQSTTPFNAAIIHITAIAIALPFTATLFVYTRRSLNNSFFLSPHHYNHCIPKSNYLLHYKIPIYFNECQQKKRVECKKVGNIMRHVYNKYRTNPFNAIHVPISRNR